MIRLLASLALFVTVAVPAAAQTPPRPQLQLTRIEAYSTASGNFTRYRFDVTNKSEYPAVLFAAAPSLPPCGTNTNSSRAWVDFFDARDKRLYGFCALGSPDHLGSIWFALPEGTVPPSYVYIEIHDRQTGLKYRSNLAETSL
jgi:hypothetical protein